MYCSNCGTQVPDNSHFCSNCGHNLQTNNETANEQNQNSQQNTENNYSQQTQDSVGYEQNTNFENNTSNQSQTDWSSFQVNDKQPEKNNSLELVLKIFCVVFAIIFAYQGLSAIFSNLVHLDYYSYVLRFNPFFIFTIPISIVSGLIYILTSIILIVFGFKRSSSNSAGLSLALIVACILIIVMLIIRQLFNLIVFGIISDNTFFQFILTIICAGGAIGLLYALKQSPDFNSFAHNTGNKLSNAAKSVKDAFCDLLSNISSSSQNNTNQYNNMQYNNQQNNNNFQQSQYNNITSSPLQQDRNIFVFIILNIITCGIYGLYTIYSLANDVNKACEGDGQTTSGLLVFILLSIVTCGIYSFYWYYALANRIAANAPRYGMNFQENGTSVLLWMLLGSLLCGIGYWIAYHIIFKNMNILAAAYNNRRF